MIFVPWAMFHNSNVGVVRGPRQVPLLNLASHPILLDVQDTSPSPARGVSGLTQGLQGPTSRTRLGIWSCTSPWSRPACEPSRGRGKRSSKRMRQVERQPRCAGRGGTRGNALSRVKRWGKLGSMSRAKEHGQRTPINEDDCGCSLPTPNSHGGGADFFCSNDSIA